MPKQTGYVDRLTPDWRARMHYALDERLDDPEHQPPLSAIWPSHDGDRGQPTRLGATVADIMNNLMCDEPTDPW